MTGGRGCGALLAKGLDGQLGNLEENRGLERGPGQMVELVHRPGSQPGFCGMQGMQHQNLALPLQAVLANQPINEFFHLLTDLLPEFSACPWCSIVQGLNQFTGGMRGTDPAWRRDRAVTRMGPHRQYQLRHTHPPFWQVLAPLCSVRLALTSTDHRYVVDDWLAAIRHQVV
jgi:hypothetical protein